MSLAEFHEQFPHVCDRLLQTRRRQRLGHAYLLAGDRADWLERFARAWARVCACMSPTPAGDACGRCLNCERLAGNDYPELFVVRPQSRSRRILVDEVRALERQLGLAVGKDRLKIGLILEAECMGEEAQNAFLKTLEEPYPHTLLLLCTTRLRRLLPTIRSRCQTISLLRNQQSYDLALELGVIPVLARLTRGAGAFVGLSAAHRLAEMFGGLRDQAQEAVGSEQDARWEIVAAADRSLEKRLEQERDARIEAEYRRLREEVCDAILTWFLLRRLIAAGVEPARLPHADLLAAAAGDHAPAAPTLPDADEDVAAAEELRRCLDAQVQERLALDAFCLQVTARSGHS